MSFAPYHLHPAVVHFPLALLTVGWVAGVLGRRVEWLAKTASWLLWLGTAAAWVALTLGLLAERTAPHIPPAWRTLALHETMAYWTAGVFTVLALWRWRLGRWRAGLFLALWAAACGLLFVTGYLGAELVFLHGMGVGE